MDNTDINKDDIPIIEKLEHRDRICLPLILSMIISWVFVRVLGYIVYIKIIGPLHAYNFHIFEGLHLVVSILIFLRMMSKWRRGNDDYILIKIFIVFVLGFVLFVSIDIIIDYIIHKRLFYITVFSIYYSITLISIFMIIMIYFFMFFSRYLRVEDKIKIFFVPLYIKIASSIYSSIMIISTITISIFVMSFEQDQKILLNSFSKDALISNYNNFSEYITSLDRIVYTNKQAINNVLLNNSKIDGDKLLSLVKTNLIVVDTLANRYSKNITIAIDSKYISNDMKTIIEIENPSKFEYTIHNDDIVDYTTNNALLLDIYSQTYLSILHNQNLARKEYFDLLLTSPIYFKDEIIGYIKIIFDGSYARNIFLNKISDNSSWTYMLYDVKTAIVYDSTEYILFNYEINDYFQSSKWSDFLLSMKNNQSSYFLNSTTIIDDGMDYIVLALKINALDSVILYVAQNKSVMTQSRNYKKLNRNLVLIFVLLNIMAILFTYFINVILKTFAKTSKYAMYMKEGKGDLRIRLDIESNDEVGNLAYNFNGFLSMLDNLIADIKKESIEFDKEVKVMNNVITESVSVVNKQTENIKQTVSSVNAMMESISNISTRSIEQKEVFISVSVSINELLKTVMKINDSMTKQSASVEETSASIEEMISNINSVAKSVSKADEYSSKLSNDAKAGGHSVDEVISAIRDIEESSDQIKDIIKVIQSIAEETNLLAMNAAIEAAHAGDHGRGFAVVADQIRSLAENTANNTKTITAIIKDITKRIEKTVDIAIGSGRSLESIVSMSSSTARIISEINVANTELEVGGQDILETVKQLNIITEQVKDNVVEQINSGDVVDNQMKILNAITSDITSTIESNVSGVKDIIDTMTLLNSLSERSKESNDNLFNSITRINTKFKELSKLTFNFATKNDILETDDRDLSINNIEKKIDSIKFDELDSEIKIDDNDKSL